MTHASLWWMGQLIDCILSSAEVSYEVKYEVPPVPKDQYVVLTKALKVCAHWEPFLFVAIKFVHALYAALVCRALSVVAIYAYVSECVVYSTELSFLLAKSVGTPDCSGDFGTFRIWQRK